MSYLYGDSTPFPLEENFLEVLRDLVSATAALLAAQHGIRTSTSRILESQREDEANQDWLAGLEHAAVSAVTQYAAGGYSAVTTAEAQQLESAIKNFVACAKQGVADRNNATVVGMEDVACQQRKRAREALESFLLRHVLPDSSWSISWRAASTENAEVEAECRGPNDLNTVFVLRVPAGSQLAKATRVIDWGDRPVMVLKTHNGKRKRYRLAKMWLSEATLTPEAIQIRLLRRVGEEAGLEIRKEVGSSDMLVRTLGGSSETHQIDHTECDGIQHLLTRLTDELWRLRTERVSTQQINIGSASASDCPEDAACLLIGVAAPYVRELINRSGSPLEISLKRDVADGKREELFLPVAELLERIQPLPGDYRAYFEVFNLPMEAPSVEVDSFALEPIAGHADDLATINEDSGEFTFSGDATTVVRNRNDAASGEPAVRDVDSTAELLALG